MTAITTCRADGCNIRRRPDQLMCRKHWAMVPSHLQAAVYATWTPRSFRQTEEWAAAVRAAVDSLRPAGTDALDFETAG
jgi:hypothetical protein